MGDLQGRAEKMHTGEKGYSPHFYRDQQETSLRETGYHSVRTKSPHQDWLCCSLQPASRLSSPQKSYGFQEMSALLQVLKSLSHGSEDMKPLEKHERRSPGPQTPGRLVFSIKTGSRSSFPTASKWWLTNNKGSHVNVGTSH